MTGSLWHIAGLVGLSMLLVGATNSGGTGGGSPREGERLKGRGAGAGEYEYRSGRWERL